MGLMMGRATELRVTALLIAVAALAWVVTANRMAGMDMGPGTDLGGFGWFAGVWVVMRAAMMLPSLAPMVLALNRATRRAEGTGKARSTTATVLFVVGYTLPWIAAGLVGYASIEGVRSVDVGFLAWGEAGRHLAGGVIAGAALYELTPVKAACLRHCREPQLLVERWRPGGIGALWTGIEHGGFCVGCCWALMATLFALGVMSLGWMILIAALIAADKLLPWSMPSSVGIVLVLAVLGASVAFASERVPGLTIPGSPEAMGAMDAAGMHDGSSDGTTGKTPMNSLGQ
jgi:predicted metal-binding membrane protein